MTGFAPRRRSRFPVLALAGWALLAWAVLYLVTGERFLPVRVGLILAPWVMLLAMALAVAAAVGRIWGLGLALGILAVTLFAAQAPPLLRAVAGPPSVDVPRGLAVVTLSNRTMNRDMAATARMIAALNADVYLLQEIAKPAELIAHMAAAGWHHCSQRAYVIVSRHPVAGPAKASGPNWLICEVLLPDGPVTAVSVHLPRPTSAAAAQLATAETLGAWITRQNGPIILGGDLNATPLSVAYRRLVRDLTDAFQQAGRGFGFTFPTPARRLGSVGPFLRIDHLMFSTEFTALQTEVLPSHTPGADHYPVRTYLERSQKAPGPRLSEAKP